jgi:hypothetical protein
MEARSGEAAAEYGRRRLQVYMKYDCMIREKQRSRTEWDNGDPYGVFGGIFLHYN